MTGNQIIQRADQHGTVNSQNLSKTNKTLNLESGGFPYPVFELFGVGVLPRARQRKPKIPKYPV